jgi:hypothetical protein
MSEVVLIILSIIAALFAWHGVLYGIQRSHRKFQSSKPKLYELIRLTFWATTFISLGIALAIASYFYIASAKDIFGTLTFSRDVRALHLMLEADANILGGHFLLAAFQALISGFVGFVFLLLFAALPFSSFIFIVTPAAIILDFISESRKK